MWIFYSSIYQSDPKAFSREAGSHFNYFYAAEAVSFAAVRQSGPELKRLCGPVYAAVLEHTVQRTADEVPTHLAGILQR